MFSIYTISLHVTNAFGLLLRHRTRQHVHLDFWATVYTTVRPMLWDRCLSCPVCNVGVLWPNGRPSQLLLSTCQTMLNAMIRHYRGILQCPVFRPGLVEVFGRRRYLVRYTISVFC